VSGESEVARSRRVLRVMSLVRRHKTPKLWLEVAQQVVVDETLAITGGTLKKENLADVTFVLECCDMSQTTTLE